MTEPLKFCKDCRHHVHYKDFPFGTKCAKEFVINLVDGDVHYTTAALVRSSEKHCGKEGKWWEAVPAKPVKRSLWQRFKDDMFPVSVR